ncbi:murein hydrolase activator EnvC family protein [Pseudalkalibacillus berkeleyi]|uniref:Peptidoglycan DD-metalloendopeptidase family protein n=1 Tax=Pseudalkalibacillus berkeleyi TaxID=1069813 RepID=A0ABS9H3Q5_9BACL|nr:peptidoglycan DD-metalloendopeptidase family protein [Pseudalkalibacillus berkeleyi]MCF6138736.1 peptidoglycan DD-metalloendopeptidase family protein [Pseudalkalibacillus berkeleyi]
MKKKIIVAVASLSLLLGGYPGLTGTNDVASANSLNDKINDVKKKSDKNKSAQEKAKEEIEKIKHDQDLLNAEIEKLDQQVSDAENQIDQKEKDIAKTKEDIEKLKAEIVVIKKRIAERDKMLKDRVKAMYENGGSVQYIEVLLGSSNFGDFLDRVFALNQIAAQDKEILEAHKADKQALEDKKAEVESELETLNKQMKELESLKASLNQKVERKNALLSDLEEEEAHMHQELGKLENEGDLLAKQQAAFEAEKRRQAREAAKSSSSGSSASAPSVTGGMFMKPANAGITSGFGSRWGKQHAGIDLARGGTVPIVASASGTVIKSYYSSSYGNVVFIAHNINGQTYTTVYAHLRNRQVGNGASVKKGQQIGIMGNTGRSTGQHLHFEIHKGQWNSSKSNAIDPQRFF